MKKILITLITVILLASCSTPKQIKIPQVALPLPATKNTKTTPNLWHLFANKQLSNLIKTALKNNDNFLIAKQRLKEARMLYSISQSNLYPSIDMQTYFSRNKYPDYTKRPISNSYSAAIVFTYNPDFFEKLTFLKKAAFERYLTEKEQLRAVKLNIIQATANAYINLCLADRLIDINRKIVKDEEKLYTINNQLLNIGLIDTTTLNYSRIALLNAKQSLKLQLLNRKTALSELALLLGKNPQEIFNFKLSCKKLPEPISPPSFLPAEVIKQRPDIVAAKRNLLASGFELKSKERELFPSITLTSESGFNSADLNKLIKPDSEFFSLAVQLIEHIFSFGKISKSIKLARLKQKEAALLYIKTIKNAFKEIHDALQTLKITKQNFASQKIALKNQKKIMDTIYKKFSIGIASKTLLLQENISYLKQLQNTETLKAKYLSSLINLYTALGVRWKQ